MCLASKLIKCFISYYEHFLYYLCRRRYLLRIIFIQLLFLAFKIVQQTWTLCN